MRDDSYKPSRYTLHTHAVRISTTQRTIVYTMPNGAVIVLWLSA